MLVVSVVVSAYHALAREAYPHNVGKATDYTNTEEKLLSVGLP